MIVCVWWLGYRYRIIRLKYEKLGKSTIQYKHLSDDASNYLMTWAVTDVDFTMNIKRWLILLSTNLKSIAYKRSARRTPWHQKERERERERERNCNLGTIYRVSLKMGRRHIGDEIKENKKFLYYFEILTVVFELEKETSKPICG